MSVSFFSDLITRLRGLPTSGTVLNSLQGESLPAREGLGINISQDYSSTSGMVPGVSMLEGGGPIMLAPLGDFSPSFRIDYLKDGDRGVAIVNREELAQVHRDLRWQYETFGHVTDIPKVIKNTN